MLSILGYSAICLEWIQRLTNDPQICIQITQQGNVKSILYKDIKNISEAKAKTIMFG